MECQGLPLPNEDTSQPDSKGDAIDDLAMLEAVV